MSKLKVNSQYAMILNDLFVKLNLPGHADLDIIATYLAFQMHFKHITPEIVSHLCKLTFQVADSIKEFETEGDDIQEKFQQI